MKHKDGKIYEADFITFCERFPSAMDFIARITIGDYPSLEEAHEEEQFAQDDALENFDQLAIEDQRTIEMREDYTSFGSKSTIKPGHRSRDDFIKRKEDEFYVPKELPNKRWVP